MKNHIVVSFLFSFWAACSDGYAEPLKTISIAAEDKVNSLTEVRITSTDGAAVEVYKLNLKDHHSPATRKTEAIEKWESYKFGAFVCFNTNEFTGEEQCATRDPMVYSPTKLDVAGWVAAFKQAGMKYAVLTTRHASGFLLWPSPTTQFSVASSGDKTDVVKQFVDECNRQGIAPCLYYCMWGGEHYPNPNGQAVLPMDQVGDLASTLIAHSPDPNARAVILAQLYELATRFGPIPMFWIDMPNWAPADLPPQQIYDALKGLQPDTIVLLNQHVNDGRKIYHFPTDVLNGELTPPPVTGHDPWRKVGETTYYLPFEYALVSQQRAGGATWDPLGPSCWFTYGEGKSFTPSQTFPAADMYRQIARGYRHGVSNVLLSTAADYTGRMRTKDVQELVKLGQMLRNPLLAPPPALKLGKPTKASSVWKDDPTNGPDKAVDDDSSTCWIGGEGTKEGWIDVDLGSKTIFDSVMVDEAWDRIRRFEVRYEAAGKWQTLLQGTTIGRGWSRQVKPVLAQRVRLNILESSDAPAIWEFQLFSSTPNSEPPSP